MSNPMHRPPLVLVYSAPPPAAPSAARARDSFRRFSAHVSDAVGSAWAFVATAALVIGWLASEPLFGDAHAWALTIHTFTSVITFLVVLLIQNTQNRDARATQLKLDELIRSLANARNALVGLEHLDEDELARLERQFAALRAKRRPEAADSETGDAATAPETAALASPPRKDES